MDNIIYLDQPTALTMIDAKSAMKVYSQRNKEGKYDEAIDRLSRVYKNLMNEVLGRNEDAEKALAA